MLKRVLAGLSLLIAPLCWAVDTYNPSNNQLTIPSVNVSGTDYPHKGKAYPDSCAMDIDFGGSSSHFVIKRAQ